MQMLVFHFVHFMLDSCTSITVVRQHTTLDVTIEEKASGNDVELNHNLTRGEERLG